MQLTRLVCSSRSANSSDLQPNTANCVHNNRCSRCRCCCCSRCRGHGCCLGFTALLYICFLTVCLCGMLPCASWKTDCAADHWAELAAAKRGRSLVHDGYFHATRSRRSRRAQLRISSTVRNTSSTYACRRAATDTQIRPTLTILKYSFMNDALTFSQRLRTAQR